MSGPISELCAGMNALLETNAVIIGDLGRVLGALSAGDLSQRIQRDYQGEFAQMRNDANATAEILSGIKAGDQIVVSNPGPLRPGIAVTVKAAAQ